MYKIGETVVRRHGVCDFVLPVGDRNGSSRWPSSHRLDARPLECLGSELHLAKLDQTAAGLLSSGIKILVNVTCQPGPLNPAFSLLERHDCRGSEIFKCS